MTETFKQVWDALERDQAERERKFRTESEKRAFFSIILSTVKTEK